MNSKIIIALLIGLLIGSLLGGILVPAIMATGDYDYQIYSLLKKIQKDVDYLDDIYSILSDIAYDVDDIAYDVDDIEDWLGDIYYK